MAMNRLEAFRRLLRLLDREPVIANLGKNCYDLFVAGHRPENLYTWGAMGSVSSVGLGLALARPELRVVVLDGDGSLLMNLGSLATIASLRPPNLVHIVCDTGTYETTGGQAHRERRGPRPVRAGGAAEPGGAGAVVDRRKDGRDRHDRQSPPAPHLRQVPVHGGDWIPVGSARAVLFRAVRSLRGGA